MAQITDDLMKKWQRQVIFLEGPTIKLSRHKKGFSSNSSLEILDSDH